MAGIHRIGAPVAQSVEQRPEKARVGSSILPWGILHKQYY